MVVGKGGDRDAVGVGVGDGGYENRPKSNKGKQ